MDVKDFLTYIPNAAKAIELILSLIRRKRGLKKQILLEMKENFDIIQLYLESDFPIDRVIGNLKIEKLKNALEAGFDLNSFNREKISAASTENIPFFEKYEGRTTENLFNSIYLKIIELQNIVKLDTDNPNIRKSVRLINIFKLMKLLLVHIKED